MTADPLDEFPMAPAGRPLWLVTLADLALLLVGFLLLVGATRHDARGALAAGLRGGFGHHAVEPVAPAMAVAAAGMMNFAPASAALPADAAGLVAWAREAARDPRVTLTVTGSVDGSVADRDPVSGSAALLAADRARTVAAQLADVVPARQLIVATSTRPGQRAALVTLAFAGEAK